MSHLRLTDRELPDRLPERLSGVRRVSRRRMAAPAPGSSSVHDIEQAAIIATALDDRSP
jgi:multifunctional 2-oxoglutarate metabolism enzyme